MPPAMQARIFSACLQHEREAAPSMSTLTDTSSMQADAGSEAAAMG